MATDNRSACSHLNDSQLTTAGQGDNTADLNGRRNRLSTTSRVPVLTPGSPHCHPKNDQVGKISASSIRNLGSRSSPVSASEDDADPHRSPSGRTRQCSAFRDQRPRPLRQPASSQSDTLASTSESPIVGREHFHGQVGRAGEKISRGSRPASVRCSQAKAASGADRVGIVADLESALRSKHPAELVLLDVIAQDFRQRGGDDGM